MIRFEHKYNIGDVVFHATPESDKGIIVNISYNLRENAVRYEVAFGRMDADNVWCYEEELSLDKIF